MSKLTFIDKDGTELYSDASFGNNNDLTIKVVSPNEVHYPYDFSMFIQSVKTQRKLQKALGNSFEVKVTKSAYKTISEVDFVSLEIKLVVGQGKIQKNILIPFVCPIDIINADEIIKSINED